ncbi:MAG: tetratricopeptide repeat protein, partial [Myxococcota bacterium]
ARPRPAPAPSNVERALAPVPSPPEVSVVARASERSEVGEARPPVAISGLGAFAELAYRHLRSGDHGQARRIFESLTVLNAGETYYWLGLGVAAERSGDLATSERALRRAGQLDPRHPVPYVGLAEVALARGRPRDAHIYLTRALQRAQGSGHTELSQEVQARLRLLTKFERSVS